MQLVDTHCHLQFKDYPDPKTVIQDAKQAGVSKLICVGTKLDDCEQAVSLANIYDNVWAACGAHPHEAKDYVNNSEYPEHLAQLLKADKVVAMGEIGLDYYKNYCPHEIQQKALISQIEIGLPTKLPFIFHVRDAWEDFWNIVDNYPGIRGVVHSFSAGRSELDQILARGFYVGLNGIMTFTKDERQLAAAKVVPADKLLLETDAPFLTPAPERGKLCEPKHLAITAQFLAELRGESVEELASKSTDNAKELFGI